MARHSLAGAPNGWATPKPRIMPNYKCYPGQTVRVVRGLEANCNPLHVEVIREYDNCIALRLDFANHSRNMSVSKASLLCGDVILKDLRDRTITPNKRGGLL